MWAVIPARLDSRRLPGKVLALVGDLPLVEHVRRACVAAGGFERVVVATDRAAVADVVRGFGGEAEITAEAPSGTARASLIVPEAVSVMVVQADQPFLRPADVRQLAQLVEDGATVATLWAPLVGEPDDPARVKVRVCGDEAVDFSRRPFPAHPPRVHLGLYAFGPGWLGRCGRLPRSDRARKEDLEQLTWLDAGVVIRGCAVDPPGISVDTPGQLLAARALTR